MHRGAAIGIICKTPRPGLSKTRLLSLLGPDRAAELAAAFLRDVAGVIESVPAAVGRSGYAVYAPEGSESQLRPLLPASFELVCRRNATLGIVLLSATVHLLEIGHDCVVLVNADSPTMPPLFVASAIATLRAPGDRLVLGPAIDGGYYMIGLKRPHSQIFADIPWSTEGVLAATRSRATEIGLTVVELPLWYDIDDKATFDILCEELRGKPPPFAAFGLVPGPALATRAFLAAAGIAAPGPGTWMGAP
jgi:rSAM/selenodomain-associated transferase 1